MKMKAIPTSLATMAMLATAAYAWQDVAAPAAASPQAPAAAVPQTPTGAKPVQTPATPGAVAPTVGAPATKLVTQQAGSKVATTKRGKPGKPAKPVPPPKPAWEQFPLNNKSTLFLDFTDANADMVFSIYSRTSGITIVKDPSFKIPLTVTSAKAVPLNKAFAILNTVLGFNGYELQKQGDLMVVGKKVVAAPAAPPMPPPGPPPTPPATDEPELHVYPLVNASASQVARVVNEVFSQQQLESIVQQLQQGGGFQPGPPQFGGNRPQPPKIVRASSEDYTNSVIVNAPKKYQDMVVKLIAELDKPTGTPLVSQVFKLQHVAADDVVDAITNVLSANAPLGRGAAKQQQQDQNPFNFYYRGYGQNSQRSSGETAIAIKQTNSVIVSATAANMETVKKLIESLDTESAFVGTTFVVPLENAKATDLADLLNKAFTKRRDQNQDDNPFFFIYSDFGSNTKKDDTKTDIDNGKVVNIRDLTGKVNVMADANTNSLIVVTAPSNMPLIRKIIDQVDKIAEQVMIETVIVEANLDKTTKLGVEWNFLQNRVLNNSNNTATGGQFYGIKPTPNSAGVTSPDQGFTYTLTGKDYSVFVNALQTDTRFKVLSTPRIFTSNNVKAEINVSQKVPYITSQQSATLGGLITAYDFKDVGVVLTVTPRITAAQTVSMDVVQSADDLQGFTTYNAPIINHRQASTTAWVKDGQTIVLGGIIRSTKSLTENKIPLLGDLPLLGPLFRNTVRDNGQTELLVLLTPHIIHSNEEAQRLRAEEQKRLSQGSQDDLSHLLKEKDRPKQ